MIKKIVDNLELNHTLNKLKFRISLLNSKLQSLMQKYHIMVKPI
jgi:hypothetical protein